MRYVILSDIHSGDVFGLANPANVADRYKPFSKTLFDWYTRKIEEIPKVDGVLCPGELTEGPGKKSTLELWTSDMEEQAITCAELIAMWGADEHYLCYSSGYHAGDQARTDHMVVDKLKLNHNKHATIRGTQRLDIAGLLVNMYHVVSTGSTFQGFAAGLFKAVGTDVLRGAYRGYDSADLYIRGHSHIYGEVKNNRWASVNCPSLKWPMGQYGLRIDRPFYAMGLMELEVESKDKWELKAHIFDYDLVEETYAIVGQNNG